MRTKGLTIAHLRHTPSIQIKGMGFDFVELRPNLARSLDEVPQWIQLQMKPIGLNDLTETDLVGWGITLHDLKAALDLATTQQSVIECSQAGLLPNLKGRQYSWLPEIEVDDQGSVFVTVKAGHVTMDDAVPAFSAFP